MAKKRAASTLPLIHPPRGQDSASGKPMYVEALQQFVRPSSSTSVALAPVFTREDMVGHIPGFFPTLAPDLMNQQQLEMNVRVLKHGAQQRGATHAALRSSSPVNPECTSLPLIMQQRNREAMQMASRAMPNPDRRHLGEPAVGSRARGWESFPDHRGTGPVGRLLKHLHLHKFSDHTTHKDLFTPKHLNTFELQKAHPARKTKKDGTFHDYTDNALRFRVRMKGGGGAYAHDYVEPPHSYRAS